MTAASDCGSVSLRLLLWAPKVRRTQVWGCSTLVLLMGGDNSIDLLQAEGTGSTCPQQAPTLTQVCIHTYTHAQTHTLSHPHPVSVCPVAGWRDRGGCSDTGQSSREGTPPPASAAGVSVGLGDPQTPLKAPAWLLCGCPPAGGDAPHCSTLQHTHKVSVSASYCYIHAHSQPILNCVCVCQQECVCVCERLREAERLEEEKKKLRLERKQLRHTLRRHR